MAASLKISELNALTAIADDDLFLVTDTSATTSKKIAFSDFKSSIVAGAHNLMGVSTGAAHLGTFSGSTIADSQTIKQALQSLEKEHGQPLHTLIYRVDQEAIDFQQREFCWRFQNRYAATLDVATLRFLDLDEGFCNAHIPGPDEAARN